jgi:hypothetical protein
MSHGTRESDWLVIRRCLAIIRRVQREPTGWQELVEAVLQDDPDAYGQSQDQALRKRFYRDLDRIRHSLYIELRADPRTKQYTIRDMVLPLLDLPDEDLTTIAWLEQTFHPNSPRHQEIKNFLDRLRFYLSPERRWQIEQQRAALILELGQQDEDQILPEVETGLQQALARRCRVEFDYLSHQNPEEQPRCHVVDIYEPPRFEASLGHYYVWGWCHYNRSAPTDRFEVNSYRAYRLGRIKNLRLLSNKLQPTPPVARRYKVIYQLSPAVARQGITRRRWIDIETIEQRDDGSAIIYGLTDDRFFALQELMHYRYNCHILGGPEILAEMQETVQKMADLYSRPG